MKKSILLALLCGLCLPCSAQLTNNGATIVIEQGAMMRLRGNVVNRNNAAGTLINSGEIIVEGDLVNTGTINSNSSNSVITFTGSSPSEFTVGNTQLAVLKNEKNNADIHLIGDLTVGTEIDLTLASNANLNLDAADLTLGASAIISGAGNNHYIATDGTGYLIKEVESAGSFTFPVGNTGGSLTELVADYTGTSFSNAHLKVRVDPTAEANLPAGLTDFINRRWEIIAENITGYRNEVSATYLSSDVSGEEIPIKGASYGNGEWSYLDGARLGTTLTGTIKIPETAFTGSGFDASALPVELFSFAVIKVDESTANINWATASEENTAYFEVERSTDAISWESIARVTANGNSQQLRNYGHLDEKIPPGVRRNGTVYYRLNLVDFGGYQAYSPIKEVRFAPVPGGLIVYPNPTADVLNIDPGEAVSSVQVYSALGRRIMSASGTQLNFRDLPAGDYLLRIETASSVVFRKVTKMK